ncbi:hypothetical protein D3C75_565800 [compost metagenome]
MDNKTFVLNNLDTLIELDEENKGKYISLKESIDLGMFDKSILKCRNQILTLQIIKTKNIVQTKIVELINNVINYFDSIITALILIGEKERPDFTTLAGIRGQGKSSYAINHMIQYMKMYRKEYVTYFDNEQRYDEIGRNLDRTRQLRSLGQGQNKHNGKVWG